MNRPKTSIKLLNIKPGEVFMYRTPWGLEQPCTFVMTKEPGWLRGYCKVDEYQGRMAIAYVKCINPLLDGELAVAVERYVDGYYTPKVSKISCISAEDLTAWYNEQISERHDKMRKMNNELEWLTKAALQHVGIGNEDLSGGRSCS